MIFKETIETKKEVITEILCDSCGKSCKKHSYVVNNPLSPNYSEKEYVFESMELSANWGYFSDKDTEQWTAHICEKCVDEKFGFIKFNKTNYI